MTSRRSLMELIKELQKTWVQGYSAACKVNFSLYPSPLGWSLATCKTLLFSEQLQHNTKPFEVSGRDDWPFA